MPADWAKLHALLTRSWEIRADSSIPRPPIPLILAGAAFSSAAAIRHRWYDLVTWANTHGFSMTLASHLPPPPDIDVAEEIAGVSADGNGWWPVYGEQMHVPKIKPSKQAVAAALTLLKERWPQIAGPELSSVTRPSRFRGRKARRLLVSADPSAFPPWGTWYSAYSNPRLFTSFRLAVNQAIVPLEVDDVSFVTNSWSTA